MNSIIEVVWAHAVSSDGKIISTAHLIEHVKLSSGAHIKYPICGQNFRERRSFLEADDTHKRCGKCLHKYKTCKVYKIKITMAKWLDMLLSCARGLKKWNTGDIWVCEAHRIIPFEMGTSFDCKCGAPGMPPYISDNLKFINGFIFYNVVKA